MTVESLSDLAVYLADFGKVVTYTRASGAPVTMQGIYDAPGGVSSGWQDSPGIVENMPRIVVRTTDLPHDAAEGDAVSIAGVATPYQVRAVVPDGTGVTRLDLTSTA